ncbi:MAG: cytochrome c5 family protein [Chlorobiaceae bacterium]|nr:cytochrome c5 family protein [Chlorobiaceae bacterium]NTW09780.1 cytochrome c5 family protein [Chlorobiaceae bacterium]
MKHCLPLLAIPLFLLSSCAPEKNTDTEELTESRAEALAEQKYADSKVIYETNCAACHDSGMAGAPKPGDASEWEKRMAQGFEALVKKSIEGYEGNKGVMPPKGGNENLTENEFRQAVSYMSGQLKPE